jgi:hypothetical protein
VRLNSRPRLSSRERAEAIASRWPEAQLSLYAHPLALYCQKVLVAPNELGVAYEVLEEQLR